jgi:competence CoiA-like predicted nuclease
MERKVKRKITHVLEYETGECIEADLFFKKPLDEITIYRSRLQQAIEKFTEPLFGCYYCKQKIRIRGGIARPNKRKADIFHFAHLKDSNECHIKTNNQFTKEEIDRIKYNGAKESPLHQKLKYQIAECLGRNEMTKREVSSVEVEKVIIDKAAKEWKKPDISACFNDKQIALEIQLSTTWLDVITRRQHFYKEQGIYIFWVFHTFNENDDLRKLTYNDVIYTNNQNAYVFDQEVFDLSKSKNDLFLKCFYKVYYRLEMALRERWESSIVKLSDLKFDEPNFRIYYHDSQTNKKIVEQEIIDHIYKLEELRRVKFIDEQEKERKRQEQLKRQEELEKKIENIKKGIKEIIEVKGDIQQKEKKSKSIFAELKDFVSKAAEHADKIVKYFVDQHNISKPFYEYDDLFKSLKEEFEVQIEKASLSISDKKQEEEGFTKILIAINNVPSIEVSGKIYSCLSNAKHWDFIKKKYSQIKVIDKTRVKSLFAADDIRTIKSNYEVNHYQYAKDVYFLMDFSSRVKELNLMKKITQEFIEEQIIVFATAREKIKNKIETHLEKLILEEGEKLKDYSDSLIGLNNEIDNLENKLKNLEQRIK